MKTPTKAILMKPSTFHCKILCTCTFALLFQPTPAATLTPDEQALLQAVQDKDVLQVQKLLQQKPPPNVNTRDLTYGATLLHWAALQESASIAALLLIAGADVHATDNLGNTPLHAAVRSMNKEVAILLKQHRADPNARNKAGKTPFDVAKTNVPLPEGKRSHKTMMGIVKVDDIPQPPPTSSLHTLKPTPTPSSHHRIFMAFVISIGTSIVLFFKPKKANRTRQPQAEQKTKQRPTHLEHL